MLSELGAYGESGDPRLGGAVRSRSGRDGILTSWLLALRSPARSRWSPREQRRPAWQAIEQAGRPFGISCVGHEAPPATGCSSARARPRASGAELRARPREAARRLASASRGSACWSSCSRSSASSSSPVTCGARMRSSGCADAVRRLGELGSPQGILDRAAEELGRELGVRPGADQRGSPDELDRRGRFGSDDATVTTRRWRSKLRAGRSGSSIRWSSDEVARGSGPRSSTRARPGPRGARRLIDVLGWDSYVVAAIVVEGVTVGLLHGDALDSGRRLDSLDLEVALAVRGGTRGRVRARRAAGDAPAASPRAAFGGRVDERPARPAHDRRRRRSDHARRTRGRPVDGRCADRRARSRCCACWRAGRPTSRSPSTLVVREGTIKYHVKNILRKLGATEPRRRGRAVRARRRCIRSMSATPSSRCSPGRWATSCRGALERATAEARELVGLGLPAVAMLRICGRSGS